MDDMDVMDVEDNVSSSIRGISQSTADNNPQPEHLSTLKRFFGHERFKPMQWKIISSVLNDKRDCCAVMTTGYGKSLCFQFPSVFMNSVTFVISPLISLMQDQVLSLIAANIPACLLGKANRDKARTYDDIKKNKYRLVYLTPEFARSLHGRDLLYDWCRTLPITLIAIDEAHCVSSWGHDFRPEYRQLGKFRALLPDVPVLAVTATATEKVKKDIITSLNLRNPLICGTSFDRPNFYFAVNRKSTPLYDFKTVMELDNSAGKWKFSGPTIIYCIARHTTEEISSILKDIGVNCAPYHAGLKLKVRKETHEKFVKDEIDVVVATIAFGMGIDKPGVRNVIHYGVSDSIEAYFQEVGRAGRDGQPSNCISFYGLSDFEKHAYLRVKSCRNPISLEKKTKMMKIVKCYLRTRYCRRKFIMYYFGENIDTSQREICCDNCQRYKIQEKNGELQENTVKPWLNSSCTKDVRSTSTSSDVCQCMNCVMSEFGLFQNSQAESPEELNKRLDIYRLLLDKRQYLAFQENCLPCMIASEKALMDMATLKPITLKMITDMNLEGFTATNVAKFGLEFLSVIHNKMSIFELLKRLPLPGIGEIDPSEELSFALLRKRFSMLEIANIRECKVAAIEEHLNSCLLNGFEVTLQDFGIDEFVATEITNAILTPYCKLTLLGVIKKRCSNNITFDQIKAFCGYLRIRDHLTSHNIAYEDFEECFYYELYNRKRTDIEKEKQLIAEIDWNATEFVEINAQITDENEYEDEWDNNNNVDNLLSNACSILEETFNEESDTDVEEPPVKRNRTKSFTSSDLAFDLFRDGE